MNVYGRHEMRAELESVFQFEFLFKSRKGKLFTEEVSALDGTGLEAVADWITHMDQRDNPSSLE